MKPVIPPMIYIIPPHEERSVSTLGSARETVFLDYSLLREP
jgi:hypothetical protein